jgi:hypothetical protein
MRKVYIIGSLRNTDIPKVAIALREQGYDAFDAWYSAGPEADDYWRDHETLKGSTYAEALAGDAAQHVFNFDKTHLDACDIAVLVYPAGKSAHLELGYCVGRGKKTVVFMQEEPERYDVMLNFADKVVIGSVRDLIDALPTTPYENAAAPLFPRYNGQLS